MTLNFPRNVIGGSHGAAPGSCARALEEVCIRIFQRVVSRVLAVVLENLRDRLGINLETWHSPAQFVERANEAFGRRLAIT